MEYILIIIAFLLGLTVSLLLLRVRIRLAIDGDRRLLFLGLGRSGPEVNLATRQGEFKLFGRPVRSFDVGKGREKPAKKAAVKKKAKPKRKPARQRSWGDLLKLVPRILRASGGYLVGLVSDAIVEEARGEIEGGFDEPHLTGQAFGFYQAALAVVPGMAGHFAYTPDWTGASFTGSARVCVAWPVYRLVYRTGRLLLLIRIMRLIRLAIGTRKGESDVQQRS